MKRCSMMVLINLLILIVVVCNSTITVRADNTEDLLNIYGLTLGGPIRSEIEEQIRKAEQSIMRAEGLQRDADEYNKVIETVIAQRQQIIDESFIAIKSYTDKNIEIANTIEDNLLDGSINDLLRYDNAYKTNVNTINQLLTGLDYYTSAFSYQNLDIDLDKLSSNLVQAQTLYSESIDAYELGDVNQLQFIMDTDRKINSAYGLRVDPLNTSKIRFHSGTDYRASEGTPVGALFNGVVVDCGWSNDIGNYVIVQSGENIRYLICHCSSVCVEKNQEVSQYDVIAYTGSTGTMCTGPHLHMALYINGNSYDVDKLYTK